MNIPNQRMNRRYEHMVHQGKGRLKAWFRPRGKQVRRQGLKVNAFKRGWVKCGSYIYRVK